MTARIGTGALARNLEFDEVEPTRRASRRCGWCRPGARCGGRTEYKVLAHRRHQAQINARRCTRDGRRGAFMKAQDHICAAHAICFQCFKEGAERTRARARGVCAAIAALRPGAPRADVALDPRDRAPPADARAPRPSGGTLGRSRACRSRLATQTAQGSRGSRFRAEGAGLLKPETLKGRTAQWCAPAEP